MSPMFSVLKVKLKGDAGCVCAWGILLDIFRAEDLDHVMYRMGLLAVLGSQARQGNDSFLLQESANSSTCLKSLLIYYTTRVTAAGTWIAYGL